MESWDHSAREGIGSPPTHRSRPYYVLVLVLVYSSAIAFALQVTPEQSVSILGQSVSVGATAPSFSLSGPGELVPFGQSLPTRVEFFGPVRPRLVLTDITINEQVEALFAPDGLEDRRGGRRRRPEGSDGTCVGDGFVALGAGLLLGAIAGWRGYGWKRTAVTILGGVLFVEVVNVGAIMVTGATAPDVLRGVAASTSWSDARPRLRYRRRRGLRAKGCRRS